MHSGLADASRLPSPPPSSPVKPVPPRPHRTTTAPQLRAPPPQVPGPALRCQLAPPVVHRPQLRAYDSELLVTTTKERRRQHHEWNEEKNESEGDKDENENENEDEAEEEARLQDQFWGVIPVPLPTSLVVPATAPVAYAPRLIVVETESARNNFQTLAVPTATTETKMTSAPPSFRVEQEDDDDGEECGEEVAPAVPVPPRPVLPKRHSAEPSRAQIGACTSGAEPVVAVPPRPVLPKKRSTTLHSSPQLPRPTPEELVVPVPARPRLPTRGMARSDGELMRPISPRPDEADQAKEEAGRGDEDDDRAERRQSDEERLARQREEELQRRQLEQERLAPFAPKLLYSDSFYADREKQKEDSLEELRVWREEERRQAIEREREKAAKVVSIEELNVRPEGGQRHVRRSVKEDHHHRAKAVSEGRETLRREGVLLVRAIDEFKGKMLLTPDAVSSKKRKQLKFKLNDIIRVTAVNVEEGLYFGTLEKGGKAGWFPSFYVVNVVK